MSKTESAGDTRRLIELCFGYFLAYIGTGVAVKYFTLYSENPISEVGFLINNTAGSSAFVFLVVAALGWYRETFKHLFTKKSWPIIVSGLCTAIVIPTTTLMYLLPISVMVAMIIMRGSIIIVSRLVDAVQIRQGILKKKVSWEEDLSIVFALLAVGTNIFFGQSKDFDFVQHPTALTIMGFYIVAYAIRIYIMNVYKNSAASLKLENKIFFSIEQLWASFLMVLAVIAISVWTSLTQSDSNPLQEVLRSATSPSALAVVSGLPYAAVAFFSVFIFMYRGRTATFAGVLNRLTSLIAGTISTLILSFAYQSRPPSVREWFSFFWIAIATALLARSELKRKPQVTCTV